MRPIHSLSLLLFGTLSSLTYLDGSFDGCASYDCVAAVPLTYSYGVGVAAAVVAAYLLCDGQLLVVAMDLYVVYVAVASCLRSIFSLQFPSFWSIRNLEREREMSELLFKEPIQIDISVQVI